MLAALVPLVLGLKWFSSAHPPQNTQTDGKVVCLRERDLAAKMEQLFRKNLYSAALSLTLSHAPDAGGGAEAAAAVRRKFGDHLYGKGDYDAAMAQCVHSGGFFRIPPCPCSIMFLQGVSVGDWVCRARGCADFRRANRLSTQVRRDAGLRGAIIRDQAVPRRAAH